MKQRNTYKFWKHLHDLMDNGKVVEALWFMYKRLDNGSYRSQRNSIFNEEALDYVLKEGGHMGTALKTYPSKSSPGKEYTIYEPNGGGEPYCDCWQWKRNRTCKHLEMYHGTIETVPVKVVKKEYKETDFDTEISEAVDNIINY